MEEVLNNKYVAWVIMGIVGAMWAGLIYFIKRQREKDDKRFDQIDARMEQQREQINKMLTELPITYTLRDEFLRVTTQQNSKLDKVTDMLCNQGKDIAAISAALNRRNSEND